MLPLGAGSLLSIFPRRDASEAQKTLRDLVYRLLIMFLLMTIYKANTQVKPQGWMLHTASAVCPLRDLVWFHIQAAWLKTGLLAKSSPSLTL